MRENAFSKQSEGINAMVIAIDETFLGASVNPCKVNFMQFHPDFGRDRLRYKKIKGKY